MSQVAAVLFLLACPADLNECREATAPQPIYESISACSRDLTAHLTISMDGRQLLGTCVAVDPAMFMEDAEIVWDVSSDRQLTAEVRLIDEIETADAS